MCKSSNRFSRLCNLKCSKQVEAELLAFEIEKYQQNPE